MDKEYLEGLIGPEAAQEVLALHQKELDTLRLQQALGTAMRQAGGRNEKAIRALLDEQAILESGDMEQAARTAVGNLKKENPWLFAPPQVSSPGTGAVAVNHRPTMEDVGKMTLAEYRRYRQGR